LRQFVPSTQPGEIAAGTQDVEVFGRPDRDGAGADEQAALTLLATSGWVRLVLVTRRTRRSATANLACIFAPGSVRCEVGQCHSSKSAIPVDVW
jgi:hypothetical protein